MMNAPDMPRSNWTALTRLDETRAIGLLAAKAGVPTTAVDRVVIWGNHSATQFPDIAHATVGGKWAKDAVPEDWCVCAFCCLACVGMAALSFVRFVWRARGRAAEACELRRSGGGLRRAGLRRAAPHTHAHTHRACRDLTSCLFSNRAQVQVDLHPRGGAARRGRHQGARRLVRRLGRAGRRLPHARLGARLARCARQPTRLRACVRPCRRVLPCAPNTSHRALSRAPPPVVPVCRPLPTRRQVDVDGRDLQRLVRRGRGPRLLGAPPTLASA